MEWDSSFNVGIEFMDQDHTHAAEIITQINGSSGEDLIAAAHAFLDHCEKHFAREESLMDSVGFFAAHCHKSEHARVLDLLRQTIQSLQTDPNHIDGPTLHDQLSNWLYNHRNTMDLVTANFAAQRQAELA